MRISPTVALAFGLGYLFGTRAGREQYDALSRQARLVWDRPEVQSVAGIVSAQAGGAYRRARAVVGHPAGPDGFGHGASSAHDIDAAGAF
jgi:hypothetical protein